MLKRIYYNTVFKAKVIFIIGADHNEVRKEMKKLNLPERGDEEFERCDGICDTYDKCLKDGSTVSLYLVWTRGTDVPTLVHELHHLVSRVFHDRGIPISKENDETFAYYQEYWLELIQADLKDQRKKKKNVIQRTTSKVSGSGDNKTPVPTLPQGKEKQTRLPKGAPRDKKQEAKKNRYGDRHSALHR